MDHRLIQATNSFTLVNSTKSVEACAYAKVWVNIIRMLQTFLLASFCFSASTFAADQLKVGLVLERSGKDDKSFNASAYKGVTRAGKELGVQTKTVEAPDNNAYESLQRAFAEKKFDLIVAVGFHQLDAVQKVAKRFPEQKIVLVDAEAKLPNVRSVMFEEHEGSFIVGALAALHSKTGTVGFIGGMDVPLIRRFQMGYEAGVKHANPKAKVLVNYLGVTGEAWNNPPKAKELALDQYSRGADVIFAAAGNSGTGVFDAAEEK